MIVLFSLTFFLLRLSILTSSVQTIIYNYYSKVFLTQTIFFLFLSLVALNYLLDFYSDVKSFRMFFLYEDYYFITTGFDKLCSLNSLSINLLEVYTYPFIYVFLLITALSITFCLTYNRDELFSFMLYCQIILLAGYALFFTDSIIIFFFSYEMLLVPSFFILYKFAKTRRCVEAAYLMFFWTQFGALFLIFGFLYLFFISGNSTMSNISLCYFSKLEVNFLFFCLIMGFGVKLPI